MEEHIFYYVPKGPKFIIDKLGDYLISKKHGYLGCKEGCHSKTVFVLLLYMKLLEILETSMSTSKSFMMFLKDFDMCLKCFPRKNLVGMHELLNLKFLVDFKHVCLW